MAPAYRGAADRLNPRPRSIRDQDAGSYGERVIVAEDGRLYYRRGTRPRTALIALGGNRFALDSDPAFRLDFEIVASRAAAFEMGARRIAEPGPLRADAITECPRCPVLSQF